ncbi:PASTA domain-containing protein [Hymenobacter metallilatus]|uniref:PASTA domain-containing protein n=1 Tax=Hymenobacter metallilatus TaxID=2493666 RepID=A0A3R9NM26_9BACT|nr:PASTA domain-containing protein [Hymenobacter metallilatus]RSK31676.1 PASTA domain-containing protein [Hymenobacter metallilatus]
MSFFRSDTPADLLKHVLIIAVATAALVLGFFFVYLPITTNHGETIVVPKITGMNQADLEDYLDDRDLAYFVDDSTYDAGIRPGTVLTQEPKAGEKVKEGRKIYVSVSMKNPPVIKMPKLTDGSVKNAQMILKSYDLVVGQLKFVPNIQKDAVLKQLVNGKEIAAGASITKGTRVDLEVGDGLGNQEFPVPNLVNMPADEATTLLVGQGLQVGEIFYQEPEDGQTEGSVVKQRPAATTGSTIRMGQLVDLWVAGKEPVKAVE